jgi:hypothetical protein
MLCFESPLIRKLHWDGFPAHVYPRSAQFYDCIMHALRRMSGVVNGAKILIRTSEAVRLGSLLNEFKATRGYVKLAHTIAMNGARVGLSMSRNNTVEILLQLVLRNN